MTLVLYFGKMIFVSGVLYGYYWWALRNKRFHSFNRLYLLLAVVISLILPGINIALLNGHSTGAAKILQIISVSGWEDEVVITPGHSWLDKLLTWQNMLYTLYTLISAIMILMLAKTIYYVLRISRKYRWEKMEDIKLFFTQEPQAPFSFFRKIFWNEHLDILGNPGNQVLRHEIYHVRNNHSADILFLEIIKCVFWFNPFFYLIKKEIKTIHEFLADEYAISDSDRTGYAELLVWQTVRISPINITNTFFHNQIKRRITMITQINNKRYPYLSRLLVLPILFILFCAFSTSIKNLHSPFTASDPAQQLSANDDSVFQSMERYLVKNLHYPEKSLDENYAATVAVKVTIDATGKCKTIEPINGIPADRKFYAIVVTGKSKYTRAGFKPPVIEPEFSKPEFIPFKEALTKTLAGFKSDNPVSNDMIIYLRVSFKIGPEIRKPSSGTSSAGNSYVQPIIVDTMPDDKVYSKVETESTYPGGAGGWQDYLYKEFRYPQAAINNEIQGTVVVQYIVDREGNISNVVAESGPSEGGLRDEAIRVIKNSGKWIPATQNGRKVSSYKSQPITFKLQSQ